MKYPVFLSQGIYWCIYGLLHLYHNFRVLPANCKFIFFLQVYYAPMYKLKLMNEYEFMKIFGCLEVLLALHQGMNPITLYT